MNINNSGFRKTLNGSNYADSINNTGPYVKIFGNGGKDTIDNQASVVTINGGAGNDYIYSHESDKVKIFGGAGDDVVQIYNSGLDGGSTITAGTGDDHINFQYHTSHSLVKYTYGDGDDTILGLSSDDTLRIVTPKKFTTVEGGNNLYFVFDTGSICLGNYYSGFKVVTVKGGDASDTTSKVGSFDNYKSNRIITGTNSGDSIKNSGALTKISGNGGNDYIRNDGELVTIFGGAGNDTILNYLEHDYDESYDYQYNAENVTISGGKGNDLIDPGDDGNNVIQYTYGDGNDTIMRWGSNDTLQITTPKRFTTVTGGGNLYFMFDKGSITLVDCYSANVVTIRGSGSSDDDGGNDDTLPAGISSKNGVVTATSKFTGNKINLANYSGATKVNASAVTKNISIVGNAKNNSLRGGSGADTISGGAGNDTLTGGGGKDLFVYASGADVITDYVTGADRISVSGSYTGAVSGEDVILTTSKGTLTIKNSADKNLTINGKTKKFSASSGLPTGLSYNSDKTALIVGNSFTGGTIDLSNYTNVVTVNASKHKKMNLTITGNEFNNSLVGGKGSDTIAGGAGNDTLTGNGGRDRFVYSAGDDVITDYTANKDKIKLQDTELLSTEVGNNNILFTTSTGTLTLINGAGKSVTIIDKDGKEITQRYSANIAEILADNSIGEFENYNEKLTQENLITFAE